MQYLTDGEIRELGAFAPRDRVRMCLQLAGLPSRRLRAGSRLTNIEEMRLRAALQGLREKAQSVAPEPEPEPEAS